MQYHGVKVERVRLTEMILKFSQTMSNATKLLIYNRSQLVLVLALS